MKACFMGLGYIGLPTAIIAAKHGIEVIGVDINPSVVEKTNAAQLHIVEPGLADLLKFVISNNLLHAYTTPQHADAFFIVTPTPFKGDHQPDTSYVEAATRAVIPYLQPGNLFVIESTSPVGTTEVMADIINTERPELKGKIHVAYCPERVLPGNIIYELVNNDRVIGGIDPASTKAAMDFYGRFVKGTLHATNARTAEMCKLTENSSRDVQIAFANELSMICDRAGIDVWELINLANKHPRVNILWPGAGVGGHCIAVDPYFLTSMFPDEARIIAQARATNNYKADWCAERIENTILRYMHDNPGKTPRVALMGVSFKPDIDDLRESPARHIIEKVTKTIPEADYMIVEPYVSEVPGLGRSLTLTGEAWNKADIVAFLTAHTPFKVLDRNDSRVAERIVLDFAGVYK